jgi:cell division protein FtsB
MAQYLYGREVGPNEKVYSAAAYENLEADLAAAKSLLEDWHRTADQRSAEIVHLRDRISDLEAEIDNIRRGD